MPVGRLVTLVKRWQAYVSWDLSHSPQLKPPRPKNPSTVSLSLPLSLAGRQMADGRRRHRADTPTDTRALRKKKTCQRRRRLRLLVTSPFSLSHTRLLLIVSRAQARARRRLPRTPSLRMAEADDDTTVQTPSTPVDTVARRSASLLCRTHHGLSPLAHSTVKSPPSEDSACS